MPNIGVMLREEISRICRREIRSGVEATRKGTAQHRRHIAVLNRQVLILTRRVSLLERKLLAKGPASPATSNGKRRRFVAKGLRSHRDRLELSAAEFGKLVGVSAQSIYNWERQLASPRETQLATLAGLRGIGKREARARLQRLGAR